MTARKANGTDTNRRAEAILDGCVTIQNIYNVLRTDARRKRMTAAECLDALQAIDDIARRIEVDARAIYDNSGYRSQ